MAEENDNVNELWADLMDCIDELQGDLKSTIRAKRHLKNLKASADKVNNTLLAISKGKRRFI